jgi:hypothetical protein
MSLSQRVFWFVPDDIYTGDAEDASKTIDHAPSGDNNFIRMRFINAAGPLSRKPAACAGDAR